MNDYFNDPADIPPFTRARIESLNALFAAVARGFDRLPGAAALFAAAGFAIDTGPANALRIVHPFDGFAYTVGAQLTLLVANTSTGAATINVTPFGGAALGAKAIRQPDGEPLAPGQLRAGAVVELVYDGTVFKAVGGLWAEPANAGALLTLANALMTANVLPPQTDHVGALRTNGSTSYWDDNIRPVGNPLGQAGKVLRSIGDAWVASEQYPERVPGAFLRTLSNGQEAWGSPIDVQTFAASGTWTKPAEARVVLIEAYGAGGGGGSGGKVSETFRNGGAGGGGGSRMLLAMGASLLGGTEAVVVGAGGSAGAPISTSGQGNAGGNGGNTSFAGRVAAFGGKGGAGGSNNSDGGLGGHPLGLVDSFAGDEALRIIGNGGARGGRSNGGASGFGGIAENGGGGGGAGGRHDLIANGYAGGFNGVVPGGAGGTLDSRNGADGGFRQGGGGGFGAGNEPGEPGTGGKGGVAGGGGGGGASPNAFVGVQSGGGGAGGNGFCRVTTW